MNTLTQNTNPLGCIESIFALNNDYSIESQRMGITLKLLSNETIRA